MGGGRSCAADQGSVRPSWATREWRIWIGAAAMVFGRYIIAGSVPCAASVFVAAAFS